ncbi:MAG: hypothetical protein Q4F21_06330 [Lachnospiraceae bacterium]|nr:hypothetical protein [Lachnospiraceae bacterium]
MIKAANFYADICGLKTAFTSRLSDEMWDIWSWKIDPYKSSFSIAGSHLVIERTFDNRTIKELEKLVLLQGETAGQFERRIYKDPNGGTLWLLMQIQKQKIYLLYHMSEELNCITLLQDNTNSAGTMAFAHLTWLMPGVFLKYDNLTFHGVLLEHENRGIIISAASGTGKTTHARLWRDLKNALIINGDRALCKNMDGKWRGYGMPWSGTSGEQMNRNIPITALVILKQSKTNHTEILKGLDAFAAVMKNLQYPRWNAGLAGTALDLVNEFLSDIPIIKLYCRPDDEAVDVLNTALESLEHEV